MSCKELTVLYNSSSEKTISEITFSRTLKILRFRGRAVARKPNIVVPEEIGVKKEVPERQLNGTGGFF